MGLSYDAEDIHLIVTGEFMQSYLRVYRTDFKRIEFLSTKDLLPNSYLEDIGEKLGMRQAKFYKPPAQCTAYDESTISSLELCKLEAKESYTRFNEIYPWGVVVGENDVQFIVAPRVSDVDEVDPTRPTKRARITTRDKDPASFLTCLSKKHSQKHLPSVQELPTFLNAPLEESEKIPITQELFDYAFSRRTDDRCTKKEVSAVFKIGDVVPASLPFIRVLDTPNPSRTEAGYHHCWDDNIRNILQVLIPEGECVRHSHYHSETRNSLPDFGYLIGKRCVFRGEEKGPTSPGDPAIELVQNVVWAYDSAPYILGYYADETVVTFVALVHKNGETRHISLDRIDLKFTADRIFNLRRLINMSFVLRRLAEMVQQFSPEYATIERFDSIISFVRPKLVKKVYRCSDGLAPIGGSTRVEHLKTIYQLLKEADVPNTDSLVSAKDNVVYLQPIGLAVAPSDIGQLKDCILCILDALIKVHEIPVYHRDIRKENVLRCTDNESQWFLIDWEDASTTPTYAQPTFDRLTHGPTVLKDGHGPEVDIWGVGYLIKSSELNHPYIQDLGDRICRDSLILTARQTRELVTAAFSVSV
ncbi:hypothetical protein BDP27DRAFT_1341538 [Rhodocollybia butyracea]|uniref:Protein kinase domain-containing protein n=1 Tax=Rhodocollybia butyracea TaxID=206335 RepID=A0A9P5P6W5_9AGAR|nr:hypothetical protein BDP27DRAFT_1341538 [Rhodocollybia butyracea]